MIEINREHPEYAALKHVWPKYRDLYSGGEQFVSNADRYLVARQKEPADVYSERLSRAFYENYVGSIIDWYGATLFRREPLLGYDGPDEAARRFFNQFAEDCDLKGSTLSDFFRRQLIEAMVSGKSYIAIEFPKPAGQAANRAEEEALGASRAYLCEYGGDAVINWQRDERGEYDWLVTRTMRTVDDGREWLKRKRWVYYDREIYRVYEALERPGKQAMPVLVGEGPHALAKLGRTPVFEFTLGEGMWLMNKAASLQLEHFNKSNALSWALTMGLFAMPVVYSDTEWKQSMGESYYLQLGKDDRFGWTEPEGHVYEIAMRNIDRLKEEIYRVCYLMSQAGGSMSKNSALTGYSKERDYLMTQEVLRGYGDRVKDSLKTVLKAVAAVREDEIAVDVSGLDEFDIGDFSGELGEAERLLGMGIESKTLNAEVKKKLAMKYLCDARQEVKDRISKEIEEAA